MTQPARFICQVCGDWAVVGPTAADQDRLHRKVCGGCEDSVPAEQRCKSCGFTGGCACTGGAAVP